MEQSTSQQDTSPSNTEAPPDLSVSPDEAVDILIEEVGSWIEIAIQSIPSLIVATLALIVAYAMGCVAARFSRNLFQKTFSSDALADLFATLVKILVIALGAFIALDLVGLQKAVVSLLAGAGIIGLAIGFAFQDLAENFLAGLMLAARKPFLPGDIINSNGHMGPVQELNLRNTIIKNFDGQIIYIPNKDVFKTPLENFSKSGKRRITLRVGVSYGEDIEKVRAALQKALESLDFLDGEENSNAWAMEYGDSSINFDMRYWIGFPDGKASYLDAIHEGVSAIKRVFDEEDILIPFPIRTLDFGIKGGQNLAEPLGEVMTAKADKSE